MDPAQTSVAPRRSLGEVHDSVDSDRASERPGGPLFVRIREPWSDEGDRLREIAVAAKGHWGYDRERVREWAERGAFTPAELRRKQVLVADVGGTSVGWASLADKGGIVWLDDLWVDPPWMRKGIGAQLFRHALALGSRMGARRMEWEAEPNAIGFYEKFGGRYLRDSEPGVWGRIVPIMGADIGR